MADIPKRIQLPRDIEDEDKIYEPLDTNILDIHGDPINEGDTLRQIGKGRPGGWHTVYLHNGQFYHCQFLLTQELVDHLQLEIVASIPEIWEYELEGLDLYVYYQQLALRQLTSPSSSSVSPLPSKPSSSRRVSRQPRYVRHPLCAGSRRHR